jgi:hypothetical protein
MPKVINLAGKKFNKLSVIYKVGKSKSGSIWKCRCDCGKETEVRTDHLKDNSTKSCGCLVEKHGMYKTPTWVSWDVMMQRCTNPHYSAYKNYGGMGVRITDKWWKFEGFLEDMGKRPEGTNLARKDLNKNYTLENCYWKPKKCLKP